MCRNMLVGILCIDFYKGYKDGINNAIFTPGKTGNINTELPRKSILHLPKDSIS